MYKKCFFKIAASIILLITFNNSKAQWCIDDDNIFFTIGSGVFCGKDFQFQGEIGKYFKHSAISLGYHFIKEGYTLILSDYMTTSSGHSFTHAVKINFIHSLRFSDPLYLNFGYSILAGQEKINDKKKFIPACRFFIQSEVRICTYLSTFFEPAVVYRINTMLKNNLNITASAGIKIYLTH